MLNWLCCKPSRNDVPETTTRGKTYLWEEKNEKWIRVTVEVLNTGILSVRHEKKLYNKYLCHYNLNGITIGRSVPSRHIFPSHLATGCNISMLIGIPEQPHMNPRIGPLYFIMTRKETMKNFVDSMVNMFKPTGPSPAQSIENEPVGGLAVAELPTAKRDEPATIYDPNRWGKGKLLLH